MMPPYDLPPHLGQRVKTPLPCSLAYRARPES
jgi:hypothetical protein